MNVRNVCIMLIGIAGLVGCGNGNTGTGESTKSDPPKEGVFDPMVETLDRAKSVEDVGLDRKAEMDERMDELDQ